MARVTKLNPRTVGEYLNGGHGVEEELDRRASRTLSAARSNAPVATGAYRASLHVETTHTDRVVKRVRSNLPYALVVEARKGVLSRALDAAGGS